MMKKTVSLLLVAALILSVFAGCGEKTPQPTETQMPTDPPTEPALQVELELPGDERPYLGVELQALLLLSADDPRAEVVQQASQVFEMRTGAKVKITWLHGDENLMAANLTGGGNVDIFAASSDSLQQLFLPYTMDLSQLALEADYADHSHYVLREQIISQCGYLAAIPQEPLLYGLYYNADAFRDAGVTDLPESWEDFLALSGRLTSAGYMPLTIDSENAHLILELFLERHLGAQQFQTMLAQALWTSTTEYIEMFRKPIDYAAAGYLAKGDPAAFPGGQDKIALSNVAMVAGSTELCAQVERSTMMNVNWGVMAFPGDGPGTGCGAESRVLAVHKDSANARAAFDFIMLLTTGEYDRLYAEVVEGIPADPANECTIQGAKELLNRADIRGMGLLNPQDNELFTRLWNGWYKTPSYFASAMNGLSAAYKIAANPGVG